MAEPIPSASNDVDEVPKPTNAEDRKAAAALDALNANAMSQENGEGAGVKQPSAADQEALKGAMSRLEIAAGKGKKTTDDKKKTGEAKKDGGEVEVKKKIKVSQEDVQFLVNELDLSKNKATELLRGAEGSLEGAVRGFVIAGVKG
ncbi:hypothetical protein H2198_005258 [Neophaeococcomyces mojaviensis]|uniref:Uncharacterized protein n=1 Tax=Neophaeococcomyces mojaviensis TaxID=3383035 RepID=A0ACC3A6I1_9EURO|nr:hypothetical protein H2198_005258 [Knufia sp. JES_112]